MSVKFAKRIFILIRTEFALMSRIKSIIVNIIKQIEFALYVKKVTICSMMVKNASSILFMMIIVKLLNMVLSALYVNGGII